MHRIRTAVVAALLASFVGLQPAPAMAGDNDRRDRKEDRWDRHEDRRDRREHRRHGHEYWRERRDDRYDARRGYWDAAQYYRPADRRRLAP